MNEKYTYFLDVFPEADVLDTRLVLEVLKDFDGLDGRDSESLRFRLFRSSSESPRLRSDFRVSKPSFCHRPTEPSGALYVSSKVKVVWKIEKKFLGICFLLSSSCPKFEKCSFYIQVE